MSDWEICRIADRESPIFSDEARAVQSVVDIPLERNSSARGTGSPGDEGRPLRLAQFVAGPENGLVEVVVQWILDPAAPAFNPVVLCGPPGTGKTHLATGLAATWKASFPRRPAVYVTAADFARQLADAIETQTTEDFAATYRGAALLVIEDLDLLEGKEAAQQEFLYTLDAVIQRGGRVVVTCRRVPERMAGFPARLRARLMGGLVVPLVAPEEETRLAVVRRLARLRSVEMTDEAARRLAERLAVTVPELAGALLQLEVRASANGGVVGPKLVARYLDERGDRLRPTIREIALAASRRFSVGLGQLRGPSRQRGAVTARGAAMYLARKLTGHSLREIGEYFGGRDHTTVSHACRKVEETLPGDPTLLQAVTELEEKVCPRSC